MILFSILLINLFLSYLVGKQGEKKELGFVNAFLLSLFFSPIISMLFVINSPTSKNGFIKEEVVKIVRKLTEEEIKREKFLTKRDISIRVKFLIVFLMIITIMYFLK